MTAAFTWDAGSGGERFIARIAGFFRLLRDNDFQVGLDESTAALRAVEGLPLERREPLRGVLKALACGSRADWNRFDELFDAWWLGRGMKRAALVSGAGAPRQDSNGPSLPGTPGRKPAASPSGAGDGGATPEGEGRGAASSAESLESLDLRHLKDPESFARVRELTDRLARRLRHRLTRRHRLARRGRQLDLRGTIHASLRSGGLPLRPVRRKRRERPLRLVVLLDASGSMSGYGAFFVRFLHGILAAFREAEAYVFHTRLVHLSPALSERSPDKAVERLSLMAAGWSGGTRIADCLADFNRHHAQRVLNSRSLVVIVSDGYDTCEPEALAAEMSRLRRSARRIVWLNPMLGWRGYAPEARGMAAALPYIDLFAPAHNLESLLALEPQLAAL